MLEALCLGGGSTGGRSLLVESPYTHATDLLEQELFDLAHPREGSLWQELRRRAGERARFRDAERGLGELLARADFAPPYELFAEVLGARGGRRALLARLGPEAADPLDEFLSMALVYERAHGPSLQGFLHWLATGEAEVKRDLDQRGRDEVRILTVHGAKGLQAPIVFLPMSPASNDWPWEPVIWPEASAAAA